jgi:hypothetical protein
MFNTMFKGIKAALSHVNSENGYSKNLSQTTTKEAIQRMVFVDLDNVIFNKSTVGQSLIDNLPQFIETLSKSHFSGEEVKYALYGNYDYLRVNILTLPNNVLFIDTPWQKEKEATQADQLMMNAAWYHASTTNDNISIFTNDGDFADTLKKMSACKKKVSLLTNRLCKKELLNSTSNVIDTRLNMLELGISACEIVEQNINMLLSRGDDLLHHQTLNFCKAFACDNWQGYGSFHAFLEASLGKACDFSHRRYIRTGTLHRANKSPSHQSMCAV